MYSTYFVQLLINKKSENIKDESKRVTNDKIRKTKPGEKRRIKKSEWPSEKPDRYGQMTKPNRAKEGESKTTNDEHKKWANDTKPGKSNCLKDFCHSFFMCYVIRLIDHGKLSELFWLIRCWFRKGGLRSVPKLSDVVRSQKYQAKGNRRTNDKTKQGEKERMTRRRRQIRTQQVSKSQN